MLDASRHERKRISVAILEYQEKTLNQTVFQFPLVCPEEDFLDRLLETSLIIEKNILPFPRNGDIEQRHRDHFACAIDVDSVLADARWEDFFRWFS